MIFLLLLAAEPHWAFQPLARADGPIDGHVAAALGGLVPNGPADRRTLIRRLKFDLLGLPPTPEEIDAFVGDARADAYERLVERYLASPHLGERWARHWLDVVRFAETTGFETNAARPNAWPYRDDAIAAFNHDRPYDRFVRDQIAGDATGDDAATGFLVGGAFDQVKGDPALNAQQRADELHDMIGTTSTAFLGLTAGCARCHDHKFDPIPQRDYYALKAVFEGVQHGDRTVGGPDARRNEERFAATEVRFVRFSVLATNSGSEPCLDELQVFAGGTNVGLAATPSASGSYRGNPIHQLKHVNDGRFGNSASWISDTAGRGWVILALREAATVDRVVWGRDREGAFADRLATAYRIEVAAEPGAWRTVVEKSGRGTTVYAGRFGPPPVTRRLWRGEVGAPREAVGPGGLSALPRLTIAEDAPEQARRIALARWIAAQPLTARVIVNRLWAWHFGRGIVDTPSDFGRNGSAPSHPALLDHLANELIASGWSLKHVHRRIVLSEAFRRSSAMNEANRAKDASNRRLWRYAPRRLEAEAVRDAMLSVSGALDGRMGGPGFDLFEPRGTTSQGVKVYDAKAAFGPPEWRRMVYQTKPRMRLDDTFGVFDCPDAGLPAPSRGSSTTPLQVLSLTNSPFAVQQAGLLAKRLEAEASVEAQVRCGFRLAFGREPEADEAAAGAALARAHGLAAFARALWTANEFLYVD